VLEAAERIFADEGIAIPIDEIARRAGVGIGTVYRHFPTKEALFTAIVHDKLERLLQYASSLADAADAGEAFFAALDRMIVDAARKKDLVDALSGAGVDVRASATDMGQRVRAAVGALMTRAQASGAVRKNLDVPELFALIGAVLTAAARTNSPPERLFAVVRDGLRPPAVSRSTRARAARRPG
jgi:AcrR family transcriptional regulator